MRRHRKTNDEPLGHLPLGDASVDALDARTRAHLAKQWQNRAGAELRVASVFAVLSREMLETGADPAVLRICSRAVSDEVRHADICLALARRYGKQDAPWPEPARVPMPSLEGADTKLRATLHAIAMGCINETIASAWLELSVAGCTAELPRAAIRELMADDIHHSRLGWAHVGSPFVTSAMRKDASRWLPTLVSAVVEPWMRDVAIYGDGVPEHGVPSAKATRATIVQTLEEVVFPGLAGLGIEVSSLALRAAKNARDQK